MSAEAWVVVYVRGGKRCEGVASCKEDAVAAAHVYRRDGWTAWAELRSTRYDVRTRQALRRLWDRAV